MSVFNFAGSASDRGDTPSSSAADSSLLRILESQAHGIADRIITCSEKGDVRGIIELIENGAQIAQVRGLNEYTALHYAVRNGNIHLIAELLKHGVPLEARTASGETALHLAAYSGRLLVAEQLIDKGAEIDAVNEDGETPLFYAARRSMPALVRLLLQRNARHDIVDKYGEIALDHVVDTRTTSCFDIFSKSSVPDSHEGDEPTTGGRGGMTVTFPYELLLRVILYLDAKSVSRAACVSGKWHRGICYSIYIFPFCNRILSFYTDYMTVCESTEIWNALGVRRWEKVLQSTLGFGPAPAASFRPRKNYAKQEQKQSEAVVPKMTTSGRASSPDTEDRRQEQIFL